MPKSIELYVPIPEADLLDEPVLHPPLHVFAHHRYLVITKSKPDGIFCYYELYRKPDEVQRGIVEATMAICLEEIKEGAVVDGKWIHDHQGKNKLGGGEGLPVRAIRGKRQMKNR